MVLGEVVPASPPLSVRGSVRIVLNLQPSWATRGPLVEI